MYNDMALYDSNIPLELRIRYPEIGLYCTEEAQKRLAKTLEKVLHDLGERRFCNEVAVMMRSMKDDQYKEKLKEL